ncbi:MAG: hypothetical protein H0U40_04870 [Chloroflexia bacterium]|nr:hypothetical protein [Chloroflexia bacterium]
MHRSVFIRLFALALVAITGLGGPALTAAQPVASPAATSTRLAALNFPVIAVDVTPDAVSASTDEVSAGPHRIVLTSTDGASGYVALMGVPEGLLTEEATELALLMAREDVPSEGWTYGGGTYTVDGGEASVVLDLEPGDWHLAVSRQVGDEGEEVMRLLPLAVTDAGETDATPEADVAVTLEDIAFGGIGETIPAGDAIWEFANVGDQPRQVVIFQTPYLTDAGDFAESLAPMMTGTPPANDNLFVNVVWMGYCAVLSPGQTAWAEFDLEPGTYALTSWVIDPETGTPALLQGMVHGFTVEA